MNVLQGPFYFVTEFYDFLVMTESALLRQSVPADSFFVPSDRFEVIVFLLAGGVVMTSSLRIGIVLTIERYARFRSGIPAGTFIFSSKSDQNFTLSGIQCVMMIARISVIQTVNRCIAGFRSNPGDSFILPSAFHQILFLIQVCGIEMFS